MPLLTRKKQLAAVRQTSNNLASGLDSAANANIIVLDAQGNLDVERIERNLSRDTISSVKDLVGQQAGTITFGVELKGTSAGTHAAGAPLWGTHLQGAGFKQVEIQAMSIGAITNGPFRHGEKIEQASTGATATVFMDTHNGAAELYIEKATISGTPNSSNAWTGEDTGASATPSTAPADEGFGWYPITDPIKSITFDGTGLEDALSVGDLIQGVTSGASGVVTRAASVSGDTVVYYRPVRGSFTAGEVVKRVAPNADTDIGTLDDPTGEAYVDWPPLSMRLYEDGTAMTLVGARGNVTFELEVNRQVRMNFSFRGSVSGVGDVPLINGINYDTSTPPIWESSSIGFARNDGLADDVADEIAPCLTAFSLDMGVNLTDRKCAGANQGLLEIYGSSRDATGSMDPEATLESDVAWIGRVLDGEVARIKMTVGSVDGARFTMALPGIQYTGATTGDREGIMSRELSFRATGGDLHNLVASPARLASIGGNNEMVLLYHTS